MKHIIVICLCLMLLLAACGNREPNTEGTAAPTTPTTEANTDTQPTQTTAPEAETSAPATETTGPDNKALAESCIDKSVEELFDLIGQPLSSDYAPSCNGGEGAEDGNLYYDGFTVYTLKDGENETVVFVE